MRDDSEFEKAAAKVAQHHARMNTAIEDERAAQVAALKGLLEHMHGTWGALVSKQSIVRQRMSDTGPELPGEVLCSEHVYRLGSPRRQPGDYATSLYVDASGRLHWIEPSSGAWIPTTAEQAMTIAFWPVEYWFEQLWLALEQVLKGKLEEVASRTEDRADKLRAFAYLLGGNARHLEQHRHRKNRGVDQTPTT